MRSLNDTTRELENSIATIGECRRDWALVCRFVASGPGKARKSAGIDVQRQRTLALD